VLRRLNLRIEPGDSVAIVGPSGCGKTTLLKCMLGIHAPQTGRVRIGGVDLQQLGLRDLARHDRHGDAGRPALRRLDHRQHHLLRRRRRHCLGRAVRPRRAIADEIEAMPMGWHTLVGDMGTSLSGGQRQRILLARALYKRPKFLFLDEATSALDVEREREVNAAIRQLDITRVIVAHRPETIASAGRVIVLQDGRVAQDLRSVPSAGNHAVRGTSSPAVQLDGLDCANKSQAASRPCA
jgi:ATP-binding cassette subfamily B protein RaxB